MKKLALSLITAALLAFPAIASAKAVNPYSYPNGSYWVSYNAVYAYPNGSYWVAQRAAEAKYKAAYSAYTSYYDSVYGPNGSYTNLYK